MPSLPNKQASSNFLGRFSGLVFLLVWLTILGFIAIHRQDAYDWWKLQNYEVPSNVSQLASQNAMTDYAEKVFYVNEPLITPKGNFGEYCPDNGGEQTIVLGCYHSKQNGIYVLQVTDPRLNGVEQVTAAHEMLHAAYDRLGVKERERVDAMLTEYYQNGLSDERIKKTIDSYKRTEPTELVNEMHSIFGTEVQNLPVKLEEYYRQYFYNRQKVVGFANAYQGEFTSRKATVAAYDAKLAVMKAQIDQMNANLATLQSKINHSQSNLNNLRSSNVAGYNAAVPAHNALVNAYNAAVEQLRSTIRQYNELVNARNAVAVEADQLRQELSSQPSTINQ